MNNKIPPPILLLICGLFTYYSDHLFSQIQIASSNVLFILLILSGVGVIYSAASSFRKNQTTINPLQPEQATKLVTSGIFKYSRNPMYLGMALIILALAFKFNLIGGLAAFVFFVAYITKFQIMPEEKALLKIFKDEFELYMKKTRRWL